MTADGRYTVCRLNRGPLIEYRAFLRGNAVTKARPEEPHIAAVELAHIEVPRPPPELERDNQAMLSAIRAMQKACLEHAGST